MPTLYEQPMTDKLMPPCTSQGMVLEPPQRNYADHAAAGVGGLCGEGQLPLGIIKAEPGSSGEVLQLPQAFVDVNNADRWVFK
jgi:hypothetical protein